MTPTPVELLADLGATLDALSGALASRDVDRMLVIEPRLAEAAGALARVAPSAIDRSRGAARRHRGGPDRPGALPAGRRRHVRGYARPARLCRLPAVLPHRPGPQTRGPPFPRREVLMSGLMDSLASAASALEAQRFGLDVAGQNIANVNTPGYARREALLASVPGYGRLSAGNGVEVTGVRAARDVLLARRLQQERPAEQREQAVAEALSLVETAIGQPGASVDAALDGFFDSFGRLSADPTSSTARQEVALQGGALAASFHDMAARLQLARRDANAGVRGSVDEIKLARVAHRLAQQVTRERECEWQRVAAPPGRFCRWRSTRSAGSCRSAPSTAPTAAWTCRSARGIRSSSAPTPTSCRSMPRATACRRSSARGPT